MKSKGACVSVIIPTYNEGETLSQTLLSIKQQTYSNIEVIVVDSNSTDNTREIARKFDAKVINCEGKLLEAKYIGVMKAKGKYVLFLDGDQILEKDTIERAVKEMKNCDMIILEELSYKPSTWIQKSLESERKYYHQESKAFDPIEGKLRPRFFRKKFIKKVFNKIPPEIIPKIIMYSGEITYYEATKLSKRVKMIPKTIYHIEEKSLLKLFSHTYRFGKSAKVLSSTIYGNIFSKERNFFRDLKHILRIKSISLMLIAIIRFIAFMSGYFLGNN